MGKRSSLWGIRVQEYSGGSREVSNLTSGSLSTSQIQNGKIQDLERRVALLERDQEILEQVILEIKNDVRYLKKRVKNVLDIADDE